MKECSVVISLCLVFCKYSQNLLLLNELSGLSGSDFGAFAFRELKYGMLIRNGMKKNEETVVK